MTSNKFWDWESFDEVYETLLEQWVDPEDIDDDTLKQVEDWKEKTAVVFKDYASI